MHLDYKRNFGEMLRVYREGHDYDQKEFALILGMHYTYYGRVERGENSISLDKQQKISEALNLPISELFRMAERLD